jgi:Mg2+/citrate symporter
MSLTQHPKTINGLCAFLLPSILMVYVHFLTSVHSQTMSTGLHSAHYYYTIAPALIQITTSYE